MNQQLLRELGSQPLIITIKLRQVWAVKMNQPLIIIL